MSDASRSLAWTAARMMLDGFPGGGLNIAYEAVDRHATGPRADKTALRFLPRAGEPVSLTYADLAAQTSRFANVLRDLDVAPGERVFTLLERTPALHVSVLGALKHRAVACPLFASFGPDPIIQRMQRGDAAVLVTTEARFRKRIAPVVDRLPALRHVLLSDASSTPAAPPDGPRLHSLPARLESAATGYRIGPTDAEDMALLHFTSGTTGAPKGAVHVHDAVVAHHATGAHVFDLHDGDVFWCTADPGWVTGTSYGIIAPLTHGVTALVDQRDFDSTRWYQTLQDERVSVLYTAPTALRMIMRAGDDLPSQHDLRSLRLICSVGEPLSPDVVMWGQRVLGLTIRDTWWQTETGGIMIAAHGTDPVRPGSMGTPLPGIEAAVLARGDDDEVLVDDTGAPVTVDDPDRSGELALHAPWPSMFRGYLHDAARYARSFRGDWYLTGDLVRRDADGWFWFIGRGDDLIKTSGHLVGPYEVERALTAHPAVDEAGVIGLPDPVAGQRIKAFVVTAHGSAPSEELQLELLGHARTRLGATIAPKEITFVTSLPHTRSGKIMRRLLRARELGLDEGDLSTLEQAS
jgi:acetyl-CoA synthetase